MTCLRWARRRSELAAKRERRSPCLAPWPCIPEHFATACLWGILSSAGKKMLCQPIRLIEKPTSSVVNWLLGAVIFLDVELAFSELSRSGGLKPALRAIPLPDSACAFQHDRVLGRREHLLQGGGELLPVRVAQLLVMGQLDHRATGRLGQGRLLQVGATNRKVSTVRTAAARWITQACSSPVFDNCMACLSFASFSTLLAPPGCETTRTNACKAH